jgi:hypothetical protein
MLPRAERTKKRASPPRTVLSLEWRAWVTKNLARGATAEALEAALVQKRVPKLVARRSIRTIAESGAIALLREESARADRLESVLALLRQHTRTTPLPLRRVARLSTEELELHYAANLPFLVTGLVTKWPAFRKWSPAYFAKHYGDVVVAVATDREKDPLYDLHTDVLSREMTIRELVQKTTRARSSNDVYMVANNRSIDRPELRSLWKDVRLPEWLDGSRLRRHAALWFGPAGTVTPLHHDQCNILFCQVYGRKRVRMLPPTETFLHRGAMSMYAQLDPEKPDAKRFPEWKDARVIDVVVEPGEALFIPVGWWHHVRSLDVAISFSLTNFRHPNSFEDYCPGAIGA